MHITKITFYSENTASHQIREGGFINMFDKFDKKEVMLAYIYAILSVLSVVIMYFISLIYPINALNVLNIKNAFIRALWQTLIVTAPIASILNKCLIRIYLKK